MLLPSVLNSVNPILKESYTNEILGFNEKTREYGLVLTAEEAKDIIETRNNALKYYGRVELGIDAVKGLIESFYTSAFISGENYTSALNELQEIFYYMKNETEDLLADDKLILLMKDYFENSCGGSLEMLRNSLEEFAGEYRRKAQTELLSGVGDE